MFLQSPELFDDIYDSDIHIEWKEYANIRLHTYCQLCNCCVNEDTTLEEMGYHLAKALCDACNSSKDMLTAFVESPKNEIENLTNQLFSSFVITELNKGVEWNTAVVYALQREYDDYINSLRRSFRTACFATSPYSQLMWGGTYSDCHRGFCIEYQVDTSSPEYQHLFLNLFPIIYCKSRPDMAERIVKAKDEGITIETLWDIYFHGALRKSFDWAYQNEWRLLLPLGNKGNNYTISFFPISKVFLGNRMDKKDRADIINICREKSIPYIGVTRSSNFFEMQDCETLCENCPRYLSK